MTTSLFAFATIGLTLTAMVALTGSKPSQANEPPDDSDVGSLDGIITAVYECICGPAGQARDWERFRTLMHPEAARLMAVSQGKDGRELLKVLDVEEYIELVDEQFVSRGFWERELHRDVESFGHVTHAWSTYALRFTADGEDQVRGVNSFQLFFDDERWWVTSILWDTERPDQPIPARFLPH
ncbi:hypothetical protein [Engelhardtia mirabilis]|uniref:DUF4440 domain-containing protein n=1 Tax=Engelhardtia mirabilis TaxID=2528011 RepID=A0A518BDS1_9BACT|nr:hypothetical protein Pla133_01990 [Planctomycetes bacterium Pla133]QDU99461.1 hypothetical protein Pla86_01990 [Planctomycetes bacterium Pla86]